MDHNLNGKKILILVSNGVDETVMSVLQRELLKTGAALKTVGTEPGLVNSWNPGANAWGLYFPVDQQISQTLGADFDFLVVPAGARGILKLAANPHSERILSGFIMAEKPLALMGDAVQLLEKTGLGQAANSANVLSGDCADAAAFVAQMVEHFAMAGREVKAAA
jgi:protease I